MTIDIAVISQFRPKFLEKCLKSIAKQTRIPDSVILVLSSKDKKSMALLEKFENLPIKVFYYDKFTRKKFYSYDSHNLADLTELDYVKKYKNYLADIISIELENPLARQLEVKKYLEKILDI